MNSKIRPEDISIDHIIDNRLFEPQRSAHAYLTVFLDTIEGGLVDIYGEKITPIEGTGISSTFKYSADNILRVSLSSFDMPNHSGEVIRIRKGNEEVKFNGIESYEDINIAFTDWIGADVERIISAWDGLRYNPETGMPNPAYKYKMRGEIVQYSPDGLVVRSWALLGVWINNINYGSYNRSSNDVREISGTIVIDKAKPMVR